MKRPRQRTRSALFTRTLVTAISLALIQQTAAQNAPAHGLDANGLTMDPQQADRLQRRTVGTVPFQYTGSNARLSFGIDDELQATGEGLGIFGFNGTRATLLEGWLGRHGAGGVKLGHHWLWGGATRADTLGDARDVWVAKVFGAVDRNEFHDRKATVGAGLERNNRFLDLYYERALSDERRTSSTSDSVTDTVLGQDPDGRPWQQDITTTTLVEQFAVPYQHGVGFRFGRYFEYPMVRLRAGLDYAWGDELLADDRARQIGATVSAEKFFEDTGHSLALELGYHRKNGPFDRERFGNADDDIRVGLQWRYEFGQAHRRTDDIEGGADSDRPAPWVERALRNLPAHRRQVDTYAAQRTTVTTTEGERVYLNRAPVAGNAEAFAMVSGTVLTGNVLTNDSDPDPGDTITAVLTQNVAHGTLVLNANGGFTYTPTAGYTGPDSFTYVVRDAQGAQSAPVTVNITVQAPTSNVAPVAVDDLIQVLVGTTGVVGNLLRNDYDPNDGDVIALESAVVSSPDCAISVDQYTFDVRLLPGAPVGTCTITYTITDGALTDQAIATVQVLPAGTNLPPVAGPAETFAATAGVPITGDVLDAQDTDPNPGDTLHVELVSDVTHGVLQLNPDGTFTYTADAAFTGPTDSFTYEVVDQLGARSQEVTVTINVTTPAANRAPISVDDNLVVIPGTGMQFELFNGDHDPDGDKFLILDLFCPTELGFSCTHHTGTGSINITTPSDFTGTTTFTYTLEDSNGNVSLPATVTLTAGENQAPTAVDDGPIEVLFGTSKTFDVLANDIDPEGQSLFINAITGAQNGQVTQNADGTITYTPNVGYFGPDSFNYTIRDAQNGFSQTATVSITVLGNQAPVVVNDVFEGPHKEQVSGNVLQNGDADPEGTTLQAVLTSAQPVYGTVNLLANGDFTYFPNPGDDFVGQETFRYMARDIHGKLSDVEAVVTINLTNTAPIATGEGLAVPFDLGVEITDGLLASDTDADGDPLHVCSATTAADPSAFVLTFDPATGKVIVRGQQPGTYMVSYTACDSHGAASGVVQSPVEVRL